MKARCYSVRLKSLIPISDKAFRAEAFDGSTAILPKSQVFSPDLSVSKSDAWWISAWILEQKELQYSEKKEAWFDERRQMLPSYHIERHSPEKRERVASNEISDLRR